MQSLPPRRAPVRSLAACLILLMGATATYGADTYRDGVLTIPSLSIGGVTCTHVVISPITPDDVLAYTPGGTPAGNGDTYDPGTARLNIPAVTVGNTVYTNVVVHVPSTVSVFIGGVSGADTYDGADLNIALVQAGGEVYRNVVVSEAPGNILAVAGGLPTAGPDTYNAITNELAIPLVQAGGRTYTNVVVTAGQLLGVGGVASTVQVSGLHSFSSGQLSGATPSGGVIQGRDGNFYGETTLGGSNGQGVIYRLTPAGVETVLHSFGSGPADGFNPEGNLIQGSDGNFYGTTLQGGTPGDGTVFVVTPAGGETVLHTFVGGTLDGGSPVGALAEGGDGNYYGSTLYGGATGNGTVFRLTPAGVETLLYSFSGGPQDGSAPGGHLVVGGDGNLYGTTLQGGASGLGAVVRVTLGGVETLLHSFAGGTADGSGPNSFVLGSDGNFYGTTHQGGAYDAGTFFQVTPAGTETLLFSFGPGDNPSGSLVQASDGNFYTTTPLGGSYDSGTFFRLTTAGVGTVLYSFGPDTSPSGDAPKGLIQGSDGNFYASTPTGGTFGTGTVLELTTAGVGPVLYSFGSGNADGAMPLSALVQGADGSLYGTTFNGGNYDSGAVFRVTPGGTESVLYSFGAGPADGTYPSGSLIVGRDGNLYGATEGGGTHLGGTLFRLTPAGVETVLYAYPVPDTAIPGDGTSPMGAPIQGSDGNFYLVTAGGGANGDGTVSRVTTAGEETVLYSFGSGAADGINPQAGLTQGSDGNLYGTTAQGGAYSGGIVFRVTPAGAETVLHAFGNPETDGSRPTGTLIQGSDGNFYGTTQAGGTAGSGTVFRIAPAGAESVLYSFANSPADGNDPIAGLIEGSDGNFYGTTVKGGSSDRGTVFRITPAGVETVLYSFRGEPGDGSGPSGALLQGSDGSFYGTTAVGGIYGAGNVFQLTAVVTPP